MVLEDLIEEIETFNSLVIQDKEITVTGEAQALGNELINQNRELLDINQ